jgi:rhomboid protease GluP
VEPTPPPPSSGSASPQAVPAPQPPPEHAELVAFHALLREITPRVRVAPTIVAINVAVFAAMVVTGVSFISPTADAALAWGANYGPRTLGGQPWRLVTNVFVHFGIIHLALNMLALWNAGALLERMFGPLAFTALYLAAGLTGSAASLAVHPQVVSAGASGAVFGVYGALAAFLLRQRGVIPMSVLTRLRGVALSFIAYNILFGFTNKAIDNAAHVGGLLGGAAAGALLARPLVPGRAAVWLRALLVVAGAGALAALVLGVLPKPLDLEKSIAAFSATEAKVLDRYNALIRDNQARKVDEDTFVTVLETEVIPEWHAGRERLAVPRAWKPDQQKIVDVLIRYADARERAFMTFAHALRARDEQAAEQSSNYQRDAEKILEELKSR